MKRKIAIDLLSRSGLLPLIGRAIRWSGVLCLNYHRIGDGRHSVFDRGLWSADADGFDLQLQFLKTHFSIVGPGDLPDLISRRRGRFVLITFDDGYLDNYQVAFPLLKRHGIPATFFVTTGFLDDGRLSWWDEIAWMVRTSTKPGIGSSRWLPRPVEYDEPGRDAAVRSLLWAYMELPSASTDAYLEFVADATGSGRYRSREAGPLWATWDMVRDMRDAGMTIGGHTVSHPVLAQLPIDRQWEEVSACAGRLAEELGEPMRYFSYPVGQRQSFNDDTRACLQKAGVRYAFSYYGGYRTFDDWEDFDIRRIAVEREMDLGAVRAMVTLPSVFGRAR